jgi:lysophospholipase L1-like esterase
VRFAVVGDSFTEGIGDDQPDGSVRGWADLVALGMATAQNESIEYANFAVRGRKLHSIVTEQLDAALALDPQPTLLTLNGGGNDMLRAGMNTAVLIDMLEQAIIRCRDTDARLVLLAGPNPSGRLPFGSVIGKRGDALTDALRELGKRHDRLVIDTWHDLEVRRPGYWSPDRLHLNAAGHQRVAALVLEQLGYDSTAQHAAAARDYSDHDQSQYEFYRAHVVPWAKRRAKGESSGDGRTGKHITWTAVTPEADGRAS